MFNLIPSLKKKAILGLLLITYLPFYGQWKSIYPIKADFYAVQVVSSSTAYAVGKEFQDGAIYKTVNAGQNWQALPIPANINNQSAYIGASFIDADTGYVLREYGGFLKTTNGGNSWTQTLLSITDYAEQIKFVSPSTGFIHYRSGKILKTTNYGNTWTPVNIPLVSTNNSSAAFTSDQVIYIILEGRVYKTTNGGSTWSPPMNFSFYVMRTLFFINENIGFAMTGLDTYKTQDGGLNWQQVPYDPDRLFYFNEQRGIHLDNYSRILSTTNAGILFSLVYKTNHTISWYGVDFKNGFGCAVGSNNTIVTSKDEGQTWTTRNLSPYHDEFRDIEFTTPNNGMVIGDFDGIIRTGDGGASWFHEEQSMTRPDKYMFSFNPAKDTGLIEIVNNYSYITYDAGTSFIQTPGWQTPFTGHLSAKDYYLFNAKEIFAVGARVDTPVIAHSIDGGQSWNRYYTPFTNRLSTIVFPDWSTGYACGLAGKIVKTIDHGQSWTELNPLINNDLTQLYFINPLKGFAAGWQGVMVRTTDGGATWTPVNTQTLYAITGIRFINDMVGYCFSNIGEISKTTNGGLFWTKMNTGTLQTPITKVHFKNDSIAFAIGNKTLYSINVNTLVPAVITGNPDLPRPGSYFSIFPNPGRGEIIIRSDKPIDLINFSVYDIKGELLFTKNFPGLAITQLSENISHIPAGIYMIGLTDKKGIRIIQRYVKQH